MRYQSEKYAADGEIGTRLRGFRRRAGMTQKQLSTAMIGKGFATWSQVVVSNAELGERQFKVNELVALADILGLEPVELHPNLGTGVSL